MKWIAALAALALAGCSTSTSARRDDAAGTHAKTQAKAQPAALPDFAPQMGTPAIESLSWGQDGSLRIGFADGKWASVRAEGKQAKVDTAVGEAAPVVAISPGAKLAFIGSKPPLIVRLRDHRTVMRLSKIADLETGGFFADGAGLFAVEPDGKLHVWGQSEADLDKVESKDFKRYMARQQPDFTANLSPLSDHIVVTQQNELIMATNAGKVLRWRPDAPSKIDAVVRLPAAARSLGFAGSHLAATTKSGALRVVSLARASFVPWSMKEHGDVVAASPQLSDAFAVADAHSLGLRSFADGAYKWKVSLPDDARICGLTLSPDAHQLAVCVDSSVVFVDPATGKPLAALRRRGDSIEWKQ